VLLCTGFTRNPLEYYARLKGSSMAFYSYPTSTATHRGWIDEREIASPERLASDARELVTVLAKRMGPSERLWIAHSRLLAEADRLLVAELRRAYDRTPCPGNADSQGFSCWQVKQR